ncbi:uncharacterized protein EV154DRAFT_508624 [Mucor mucedo]|uniref:uncharacterized protein n=1 Tax=Mucor mucedo TaxID=29922 RepID=UPI00222050BA|nr:uncharacterized protein EV154DRAFT_508624 [Mucor mucedo]KAI7891304.1 hypothetical protein EV154DRAFT_508624 [Mucor mucedo]
MAFKYSDYGAILSIDFGTTFSGSCYAITGKVSPKELRETSYPSIIHVTNWPKQNDLQHKTPSIIVCDRNFHLLHWGMSAFNFIQSGQVKDTHRVFEKFKLQLPSSIAQKGAFRCTGNTSQLELLSRAMQNANMVNGLKIDKEDIRFIITVPTQWNDVQKSLMRLIAIEAGLISKYDNENRLKIISESSAALLYCERIPDMKTSKIKDTEYVIMSEGEKYIICDAGGGTVSITVFEVLKQRDQDGKESFRRCQITAEIRKNCGSEVLLDICFGADKESWKNNKSKREELETILAPLTDQYGGNSRDSDCESGSESDSNWESSSESDSGIPICMSCTFSEGYDEKFVELDDFGDGKVSNSAFLSFFL